MEMPASLLLLLVLPLRPASGAEIDAKLPAPALAAPAAPGTPALSLPLGALELPSAPGGDAAAPAASLVLFPDLAGDAPPARYLPDSELESLPLEPAPAAGSPVDREDLAVLHDWQNKRTAGECARASLEALVSYETFFGGVSPFPWPLPEEAKTLLRNATKDAARAQKLFKDLYRRPRPYARDASLAPCVPRPGKDDKSYPSGHATLARVLGRILSELRPARRDEFMARADEIALDRIIGGVHHPSDVQAGMRLGDEVFAALMRRPEFRADLERARGVVSR